MSDKLTPTEREYIFAEKCYRTCSIPSLGRSWEIREEMVPCRDGVRLRTICYFPEASGPVPLVFQRLCYPLKEKLMRLHGEEFCKRGIAFVFQFCRGTGGSEGEWAPNTLYERTDGIDLIHWLENLEQVGDIGYWGSSYMAMCGWALMDGLSSRVKTMYLTHYGTDRYASMYEAGLFRHDIGTGWAKNNAGFKIDADYLSSCLYRPNVEVDEKLWGRRVDWYRDYLTSVKADDPLWSSGLWKVLREAPGKAKIPLYIGEAWFDHHFGSAMKTYEALSEESKAHSTLRIGCWEHNFMPCLHGHPQEHLENNNYEQALQWFIHVLREQKPTERRIELYVIGEDRWRSFPIYPVKPEELRRMYFAAPTDDQKCGGLKAAPTAEPAELHFDYDPENYVPTCGGESVYSSVQQRGSVLQPPIGAREDVLSFLSEPIQKPFVVMGKIKAHLFVRSSAEDTSFVVKVSEVSETGESYNIRTGITTLSYQEAQGKGEKRPDGSREICVTMWDVAWMPAAGSRIRIDITSSDFPQYAIHSNFPGIWSLQDKTQVAHQTICMDAEHPSSIEIPCVTI